MKSMKFIRPINKNKKKQKKLKLIDSFFSFTRWFAKIYQIFKIYFNEKKKKIKRNCKRNSKINKFLKCA